MDWEDDDHRSRYRLSGIGFSLIALALGLLSFDAGLQLVGFFTPDNTIRELMHNPLWTWLVSAPITWGSLVGSYLLWGRWREEAHWQRRAGLLLLMNSADALFWTLDHSDALGLRIGKIGHGWLRMQVTMAFGWAELLLIASLAADFSSHLEGKVTEHDAARAARSFGLVGIVVSALWFLKHTDWRRWPLAPRPWFGHQTFLLIIATHLLLAITAFQVTLLCVVVSRRASQLLRVLSQHAESADPLRSRSESESLGSWDRDEGDPWK